MKNIFTATETQRIVFLWALSVSVSLWQINWESPDASL